MAEQHNIIDFHSKRHPNPEETPMPLPPLVIATRRTAKHHLKRHLPEFFSQVDDSLFALADKAESNQLQNLYFDAMRETRLKKDAMSNAYRKQLDRLFNESLDTAGARHGKAEEPGPLDQVGLVGDAQLEESLALTNMVSSAEIQYRESLYGLTTRLDFLIEDQEIHKDNNPLRPDVICHAFTAAVDELSGDLKVRLVIYKLFDKHVVQQLDDMYAAINADLIAAGVLPRIKTPAQKSAGKTATAQRSESDIIAEIASAMTQQEATEQAGAPSLAGNLFASLQQMLSQHRTLTGAPGTASTGGASVASGNIAMEGAISATGMPIANEPAYTPAQGETLPPGETADSAGGIALYYAPQDIVSALSNLQGNSGFSSQTALTQGQQNGNQPLSASLIKTGLTQAINQEAGDGGDRQIGQADTDVIDIVSMLFDFILDDPHIADSIKALIARLQIPLLKVAIIDKEFFAKKTHPARQLLNELAYIGAEDLEAEDAEEENPTLRMVEYVVDRILNEFEDNPELFATLLDEFTRFVEEEREANRLAEEMLVLARDAVASEIRHRMEGQNIPPFIRALLIDAWKDVLQHIYLRDGGNESTAWKTALKVADDLIWSVQPKLVVSERQNLIRIIPRVLNGLRDGLTLIAYDHAITERIFDKLEELHLASLRGGVSTMQNIPTSTESAQTTDSIEATAEANKVHDEADEFIEEIILASTQAMDWDDWDQCDSEYAEQIKDMALGTWVEFSDPETEKHSRGKLAWKCDFTGEYTFVDRKYKVIADLTFKKLLDKFDAGHARVVEDVPLFDRALDSVINGIKRAMESKGEASEETTPVQ